MGDGTIDLVHRKLVWGVAGWLVLVGGIALDQLTKYLAQVHLSFVEPVIIIDRILSFQLVHNYGAAYGILQHQRVLLISISILVLIASFVFRDRIANSKYSRLGLLFLYIGTIGNLIDRIVRGYVVDFVDIRIFPLFNVADVCIDIGLLFFVIDLMFTSYDEQPDSGV